MGFVPITVCYMICIYRYIFNRHSHTHTYYFILLMELTSNVYNNMATIKNSSFDTNGKNNNKTNIRNGKNLTDSLLSNRKGVGTTRNGMLYSPIEDDSLESHKQTIYEAHGDLWQDAGSDAHHQYSKRTGHWYTRVWHFLQTVLFLAILGMLSSLAGLIIDGLCWSLFTFRETVTSVPFAPDNVNETTGLPIYKKVANPQAHQWFFFIVLNMLLGSFSFILTHFITPQARGSGIPRMKGVLGGLHIHHFLSFRALFAKILGLSLAYSSNISIGKEGPYVHIAACIAQLMMRTSMFKRYGQVSSRRIDMLAVACACGVAATFGAPFGGVIFAVEVVSTYFYVPNLPRMFMASICGTFIVKMIKLAYTSSTKSYVAVFKTNFTEAVLTANAMMLFILVGVLAGLFSGIFVLVVKKLAKFRSKYFPANSSDQRYVLGASILIGVIAMFESIVVISYYNTIPDLRSQTAMVDMLFFKTNDKTKSSTSVVLDLTFIFITRFALTAACLSLPIPAGLFMPVFLLGGILGRLSGETFDYLGILDNNFVPGEFAVVGAAAFAAGATRAISTAAIVIEVTGQYHMLLPVSIGVVAAYFVANRFAKPVYDCLVTANAFPHLPKVSYRLGRESAEVASQPATPNTTFELSSTKTDMETMLRQYPKKMLFPIVENYQNMLLLGEIQRRNIEKTLEKINRRSSMSIGEESMVNEDGLTKFGTAIQFVVSSPTRTEHFESIDNMNVQMEGGVIILVDPAPFSLSPLTSLHKVSMLFRTLRLSQVYLINKGKLIASVCRDDLVYLAQVQQKDGRDNSTLL